MEFAACLWVPDTSEEAVETLRAEGVTAIEPGPSFLLQEDEAKLEREARRFRDCGIRIYQAHAPFGGDDDLSLVDEAKRKGAVAGHAVTLERAALAGVECLVIHPSAHVEDEERAARSGALYASLASLVKVAERTGVKLALENMLPGHLGCEGAEVRRAVDAVDSPFLGICFDTGHAHLNPGGVSAAFAAVRERVVAFHLQDNNGVRDRHLQPPYGTIDWQSFGRELRAMDFPRPFSVEAPPWSRVRAGVFLRELRALFTTGVLTIQFEGRRVRVVCDECGHYCFGTKDEWFCACG